MQRYYRIECIISSLLPAQTLSSSLHSVINCLPGVYCVLYPMYLGIEAMQNLWVQRGAVKNLIEKAIKTT